MQLRNDINRFCEGFLKFAFDRRALRFASGDRKLRMRRRKRLVSHLLVWVTLLVLVTQATEVHAPLGPNPIWDMGGWRTGEPHGLGCDPDFHVLCVVTAGSHLTAYSSEGDGGHAPGGVVWDWTQPNGQGVWASSPVKLSTGREVVFAAGGDGFLYKISTLDKASQVSDLRRGTCNGNLGFSDSLQSRPTVQLYDHSTPIFRMRSTATSITAVTILYS